MINHPSDAVNLLFWYCHAGIAAGSYPYYDRSISGNMWHAMLFENICWCCMMLLHASFKVIAAIRFKDNSRICGVCFHCCAALYLLYFFHQQFNVFLDLNSVEFETGAMWVGAANTCVCVAFSNVFGEGPYGYRSWNAQTQWLILNFRKFMGLKIPEDGCFGWVWWESIGYFAILVLVLVFGPRYLTWGNSTSTSSENLKTKGQRTSKISTWKLDNFFQKTLKILGYPPGPPSRRTSIWNLAMTLVWKRRSHSWKSSCFRVPWHPWHMGSLVFDGRINLGRRHFRHCLRATPETVEALGQLEDDFLYFLFPIYIYTCMYLNN